MDAAYARPFQQLGHGPVALGGYLEANSRYAGADGVSEGLSFQLPRLTLFVTAAVAARIKFLTEVELEEGGREINIEFASLDLHLHPLLNLRGGVVMNPIGAFNQDHDGPKWAFTDRPLAATTIIPATWSNVGFGLYGKHAQGPWAWGYEAYITNGFDDRIIDNAQGRTWLPATKENGERFAESPNGVPLFTVKGTVDHRGIGELGLSWMGGVYNTFEVDGLPLDSRRRVDVWALDYNTRLGARGPRLTAEHVWARVDVPATYTQQYGTRQRGGFVDVVQPLWQHPVLGWAKAELEVAARMEYADYNAGNFRETGGPIADDRKGITAGLGFRPVAGTVVRANYGYLWERDLLGNPASRTASITFGVASYF
ncbi:MAG: hypothetical protein KBH07_12295 [Flavobacteriales bacterium]|nr:hypothetical protein [Flavobacteriales bacterium]MBP9080706.1 hypothetical protein [Flavobacteriales bacterium]